jgi:hypothetical protein
MGMSQLGFKHKLKGYRCVGRLFKTRFKSLNRQGPKKQNIYNRTLRNVSGTGWNGAKWIHMVRDRDQWHFSEEMMMKPGFTQCGQFFLLTEEHTALRDGFKSIQFVNQLTLINQLITTYVLDVAVSKN